MKMNTVVKLSDGRIGTICYNHLDGCGGVFGETYFDCEESINDELPEPEFMLRDKNYKASWGAESVGEDYKVIKKPDIKEN